MKREISHEAISLMILLLYLFSGQQCAFQNNHVVLTEAEEECVDTYGVDAEETVSYQVCSKHHRLM